MEKLNVTNKYKGAKIPLVIEKEDDGFYTVECPIFDGCYTQGRTIDEALKNIREVLKLSLRDSGNQKILEDKNVKEVSLHTITL